MVRKTFSKTFKIGEHHEDLEFRVQSKEDGVWVSNVPMPSMFIMTMPNGDIWDLAILYKGKVEVWPVDEEVCVKVRYTGVCPIGFAIGFPFELTVGVY